MKKISVFFIMLLIAFGANSQVKYKIQSKAVVNKIATQLEMSNANFDIISGTTMAFLSLNSIDSSGGSDARFYVPVWSETVSIPQGELSALTITAVLNWVLSKYGLTLDNN